MSMTREELRQWFVEWLDDYYDELHSEDDLTPEVAESVLTALRPVSREQVEKVWGEWVKRHKCVGGFRRVKGVDDMGEQHEITVDERCEYDDLYCSKCGKQSPDNFLNFCANCGAPMTDEAVEIRLKELEALKDAES